MAEATPEWEPPGGGGRGGPTQHEESEVREQVPERLAGREVAEHERASHADRAGLVALAPEQLRR